MLPLLSFDFNPLNLRNPRLRGGGDLPRPDGEPETTPNTLNVLAPSLAAAQPLARRLEALPEVARVMTLASFVPDDQPAKLALIQDAADLLEPDPRAARGRSRRRPMPRWSPRCMDLAISLAHARRRRAARHRRPMPAACRWRCAGPRPARRKAATGCARALLPGLQATLAQLTEALQAGPVTLDDLPPELVAGLDRRRWPRPDRGPGHATSPTTTPRCTASPRRCSRWRRRPVARPISIQAASATIRAGLHRRPAPSAWADLPAAARWRCGACGWRCWPWRRWCWPGW